jgi:alpha-tubulin suppressor-like RCC1 family protein
VALAVAATSLSGLGTARADCTSTVILAWGANDRGQLGNGTRTDAHHPTAVLLPYDFVPDQIVTSVDGSAYAVGKDGRLFAWGANDHGQIGDGTTQDALLPVQVEFPGNATVNRVVVSPTGAYATGDNGLLYAWGGNDFGQLGDGTTQASDVPVQVGLPLAGDTTLLPLTVNAGPTGTAYATLSDGTVWAWGRGRNGELGNDTAADSPVPVQVTAPDGVNLGEVSAGFQSAFTLGNDGHVYSWGADGTGLLGTGDGLERHVPTVVPGLDGLGSMVFAVGSPGAAYALTDDGVYGWGDRVAGVPGLAAAVPTPIPLPGKAKPFTIRQTGFAAYVATYAGTLIAWGDNPHGALGVGPTASTLQPPTQVLLPQATNPLLASQSNNFQDGVTAGYAAIDGGDLYAWGDNSRGQLGDGTTTDAPTPIRVPIDGITISEPEYAGDSAYVLGTVNRPTEPAFTAATPPAGELGEPYSYAFKAPALPPPYFSVTTGAQALPPGLTLDPRTGVLQGTPTRPGTYTFAVHADNGTALTATTEPVTVTITDPAAVSAPPVAPTRVTSVPPLYGPTTGGLAVTLSGSRLDQVTAVSVGSHKARILLRSRSSLRFQLPPGSGRVAIRITTARGSMSAGTVVYVTAPGVSGLSLQGHAVVVHGFGFTRTATVAFGRRAARILKFVDPMTLVVAPPAGSGTVDVTVRTKKGVSMRTVADHYVYRAR